MDAPSHMQMRNRKKKKLDVWQFCTNSLIYCTHALPLLGLFGRYDTLIDNLGQVNGNCCKGNIRGVYVIPHSHWVMNALILLYYTAKFSFRHSCGVFSKLLLCVTKVYFFKKLLDKINSSKKMQKQPSHTAANWWGYFCIFLDELILSSSFLKKTDFRIA